MGLQSILFHHFSDNGRLFQDRLVKTSAAIFVRAALMGQTRDFIFWVGIHQFITMRTSVICHADANGADTWIFLESLESHSGGGKQPKVGLSVGTGVRIIGGGSIAF